jgi:hypothetical protein
MKFLLPLVLPFVAGLAITSAFAADHEEKVEVKSKDNGKELKMKVHKKNNNYVGVYNDKEYILRGEATKTLNTEGEYTVYGVPSDDNVYFETRRIRPVTVTRETRVEEPVDVRVEERRVEERPVIREREVEVRKEKEPLVKLPGIEINP